MASDLRLPIPDGISIVDVVQRLAGSLDGVVRTSPVWEWDLFVLGLERALARYRVAVGLERGIDARIAVGESLYWLTVADDFMRNRLCHELKPADYYARLCATNDGQLLAGLVFLRNRLTHQFALALVRQDTATATFEVDQQSAAVTVHVDRAMQPFAQAPERLTFAYRRDLPTPREPRYNESWGRDHCYDDHVAGRDVDQVLNAAMRSLHEVVQIDRTDPQQLGVHIEVDRFNR